MSEFKTLETDVYVAREEKLEADDKNLDELKDESRRIQRFSSDFVVPDDVTPLPLKSKGQQVFLFNVCHKNHRPKCKEPGFRLLGVFQNTESAADFCNTHYSFSKETLLVSPMHQLIPICSNIENQNDKVYCEEHIQKIMSCHSDEINAREKDFEENVRNNN